MSMQTELDLFIFQNIITRSKKSTAEVHAQATEHGFNKSFRQMARILDKKAALFGVESELSDNNKRLWFYPDSRCQQINAKPLMTESEAVFLRVAQHHLNHLIPDAVLVEMADKFEAANDKLFNTKKNKPNSPLLNWLENVAPEPAACDDFENKALEINKLKQFIYSGETVKFDYETANDDSFEEHIVTAHQLESSNGKLTLVTGSKNNDSQLTQFEVAKITNVREPSFTESFSVRKMAI